MAKEYRVFIVQTMKPITVEANTEREAETRFLASQVYYGDQEQD